MNIYEKLYRNPFTYLVLFALSLVMLSYFDAYGGITMDAPWYLRLAQSIKDGNGFAVMAPDYIYYNEPQNFFIWPPLYPMLTGYLSLLTNLPVYISIKIINLVFIGITLGVLSNYYKEKAPIYILLLFHAAFFDMVYQGWSEVPFVCILVWFLIAMEQLLTTDKTLKWSLLLVFTSFMAVGVRYLGVITLLPFIYIIFKLYKQKDKNKLFSVLILFVVCAVVQMGFIGFNYFAKNKVTGYDWNPSLSELADFGISFFLQVLNSFDFLFCYSLSSWYEKIFSLTVLGMIVYKVVRQRLYTKSETSTDRVMMICGVMLGVAYLLIPLLMRNSYAIGLNHPRFFIVATIMILFGLLHQYQIKISYRFLFYTALIIFTINGVGKSTYIDQYLQSERFADRYERLETKYKKIKPHSAVAFADKWLEFMRPDVYVVSPYENVMKILSPNFSDFKKQVMKHPGPVYLEVIKKGDNRMYRYDSTITNFHLQNQDKEFVELK